MPAPVTPDTIFFDLGDTLIYASGGVDYLYADTLDVLQILQERGYRLGLISNQSAGTTVQDVVARLDSLGLGAYIESELVAISTEIPNNFGKPAQPIFDLALQKAGHPAASPQSIFITETFSHITAARGYGWRAILKRNSGSCVPGDGECVTSLMQLLDLLPALGSIAGTNLDLAPRPKTVDGLWAVPIDIQRINATLTFDGATLSSSGAAVVDFKLGRNAGNPIFDLRQTITGITLDGDALPVNKALHHDFGGGANAELRILELSLGAGTSHRMEISYSLGLPQASGAGSYQPHLTWSGSELTFNFGFTDLGPGRYLEAWVPSNLIFDQFEVILTLQIINTAVPHTLIANGIESPLGPNRWQVIFPATSTSFSPLIELRPSSAVASKTDTVVLPVSGSTVTVEVWKTTSSTENLDTHVASIKNYLIQNENNVGPYLYGNRFVAFIYQGGMEYDGATTTSPGALKHETFHSWWGRGRKPASQPDAWMDEGWTYYSVDDVPQSVPFNFSSAPVQLCPQNPWIRKTAQASYMSGAQFWKGIAGLSSVATLNTLMKEFYALSDGKPFTTEALEEFLLCRIGDPLIVDACHRFLHGFQDPNPVPDAWLRDDFNHTGSDLWTHGSFWNSPDLWVRHTDDGIPVHENPEYARDNWIYARVRNASAVAAIEHFVVAFNVKAYAGTEFIYPQDFLPCTAAAVGFNLAPGASVILRAKWPSSLVPHPSTHACLLASVFSRSNHPLSNKHVWEQNCLAQKNLSVVFAAPDTWVVIPFVVSARWIRTIINYELDLVRPSGYADLRAEILYTETLQMRIKGEREELAFEKEMSDKEFNALLERRHQPKKPGPDAFLNNQIITSSTAQRLDQILPAYQTKVFSKGKISRIPLTLAPEQQRLFGLRIYIPAQARRGDVINLNLVKRRAGTEKVLGGIAISVHVA